MDSDTAVKILGLNRDYNSNELRKAYYRKALKYHPDKSQMADATHKFKEIKGAYDFLGSKHDTSFKNEDTSYTSLIRKVIRFMIPEYEWDDVFLDSTIKTMLDGCRKVSLKLFDKLKKEKALEVHIFLSKCKELFNIEQSLLDDMLKIIEKKIEYKNIIILNPDIDNLLEDTIYKLEFRSSTFFVPLWHDEVIYDLSDNDLIVKNIPELASHIRIDAYNNIHVKLKHSIQDILNTGRLIFNLGNKVFDICSSKIKICKQQIIIENEKGVLRECHDDIFSEEDRGDVYIHLELY